jgi:hypothetical protein
MRMRMVNLKLISNHKVNAFVIYDGLKGGGGNHRSCKDILVNKTYV